MVFSSQLRKQCCVLLAASLSLLVFLTHTSQAQSSDDTRDQIGFQISRSKTAVGRAFAPKRPGVFSIHGYFPGSFSNYFGAIYEVEITSPEEPVLVRRIWHDDQIQHPLVLPFDLYLSLLHKSNMRDTWQEYAASHVNEEAGWKKPFLPEAL